MVKRRYGYVVADNRLMPFDLEVKNVGDRNWTAHLLEAREERSARESGTVHPKWTLLDCLERNAKFYDDTCTKLRDARARNENLKLTNVDAKTYWQAWRDLVIDENVKEAMEKRLVEKMNVSYALAIQELKDEASLREWLKQTVKPERLEFYKTFLGKDEKAFLNLFHGLPAYAGS
jgi:hypothetical protein